MRRNTLCIVKTIIAIFGIVTFSMMLVNWLSYPSQINKSPMPFPNPKAESWQIPNVKESLPEDDKSNEIIEEKHPKNIQYSKKRNTSKKKDWHDNWAITESLIREGLGERGEKAQLKDVDKKKERSLFDHNGFNALLSDHISINRSVPDIRYSGCKTKKYLIDLPKVSVVIPFFEEHWSVLLRTCYSIINRSPPELLEEIILVDDHSTKEFLGLKLEMFIEEFLPKVKLIRLPERSGLILARLAGAKKAKAEVLIFLDSHIEVNYNWLPPLLEPIGEDYRTCVCPFIDVIDHDTFEYRAQDEGARGAFDWEFYYKRLPLLPEDLIDRTKPFRSPIMAGGLFAINTKFFWDLGGYDEGLDIWGGEQYELSFKIWMCGGQMVDAPCSRVGHIYRGPAISKNPRKTDFVHKNYKRVAEVWMDEYKQYLYTRNPDVYENIDAGDLTKMKGIRKKLKCKSFKWFMENVAFDLPKKYPMVNPPDYANGAIQSVAMPNLCLDTLSRKHEQEVGLYPCAKNLAHPHGTQFWSLSWREDIRTRSDTCLDVPMKAVLLYNCHGQRGNQFWSYDRENNMLKHSSSRCLAADFDAKKLYIETCDQNNPTMKWRFGYINETAMAKYHVTEKN